MGIGKRHIGDIIFFAMLELFICGCGNAEKSALDTNNPTTVTVWNYYNGDQLAAFEELVETFNTTVGVEKGIVVVSISQGDIDTLADSLLDSVDGKAGAQDIPTLAAVYAETAYILDQSDRLAALDSYFTEEELAAYVPEFLEEGRFNKQNELLLFPISKSTEVFTANKTDWADFTAATGITLESMKTQEELVRAAKIYYEWTDGLTPDEPEDGKALYGRDSVANYIYIGSYQLGHELFLVQDGVLKIDIDRDTFKVLWDNYYIPFINGYFGAYANFRSEDCKTGKILAMTSASSSMGYVPTQVTSGDDTTHDISIYTAEALPFENTVNDAVVQQGASFCLLKSTEAQQEGAVEFLKWFTEQERNMTFSLMSGYSPVRIDANTKEAIERAYHGDTSTQKGQIVLNALLISADQFANKTPYAAKPFEGGKNVRSLMEAALNETAVLDRSAVKEAISLGMTREEAVAPYCTEEYFEAWFQELYSQVIELTQQ